MPPGLNGRVCICVCLVLTCLHSAVVSAICVFQETNEIIFTPCSWSQWMSWNCSRCDNPGPSHGPKLVFRNRGICCLDTKDLDICLSNCNFTRADGEDQAPCLPHCSNTSHQSSTGAVTILSTGPSTLHSTIPIANLSTEPSQPDPTAKPQMPNHGNTSLGSGHYNGLAAEIETSSNRGSSCSFGQWSRIEYLPDTPVSVCRTFEILTTFVILAFLYAIFMTSYHLYMRHLKAEHKIDNSADDNHAPGPAKRTFLMMKDRVQGMWASVAKTPQIQPEISLEDA